MPASVPVLVAQYQAEVTILQVPADILAQNETLNQAQSLNFPQKTSLCTSPE